MQGTAMTRFGHFDPIVSESWRARDEEASSLPAVDHQND
jgi:hypothetical protein